MLVSVLIETHKMSYGVSWHLSPQDLHPLTAGARVQSEKQSLTHQIHILGEKTAWYNVYRFCNFCEKRSEIFILSQVVHCDQKNTENHTWWQDRPLHVRGENTVWYNVYPLCNSTPLLLVHARSRGQGMQILAGISALARYRRARAVTRLGSTAHYTNSIFDKTLCPVLLSWSIN